MGDGLTTRQSYLREPLNAQRCLSLFDLLELCRVGVNTALGSSG